MYEYNHGGNAVYENGGQGIIDLSANINPLGIPDGVKEKLSDAVPYCEHYPDNFSKKLRIKIAEFEKTDPAFIFCGNGASDIIFRLPRALNAKKTMIICPAFPDYERAAVSYGAEVIRHILSGVNGFSLDRSCVRLIQYKKPDLLFICNPNNPTGALTNTLLIEEILECCSGINASVFIDECFLGFSGFNDEYTSKIFLNRYRNLVILKAFTKLFALPGIRLGYAICTDEELIQNLYFHGVDWPVSNLAQEAGIAALTGAETYIKNTVEYISQERDKLEKKITQFGYKVYESKANFIFFQNPFNFDLQKELNSMGIRIRSCKSFHGLDESYCRIAVSKKEHNVMLLSAIEIITRKMLNESA